MQLGAMFANDTIGTDFAQIRDVVQAIEETGFDSIATNDHVIGGHPDRAEGQKVHVHTTAVHEPLVLLSFIGAVTSRVELVTSILILPQRQTTLVAKQVAELDLLSGGRVRLGVECGVRIAADDDSQRWAELARAYRDLGATHLKVMAGPGFDGPADRLAAMIRWYEVTAEAVP